MRNTALKTRLFILLVLLVMGPASLLAHDPEQHGFRLVKFSRPAAAPDFSLPDLSAQPRQLSDFKGHYVLLNFWATWCPPCLNEMPSMENLYQKLKDRSFVVVAVSTDKTGADHVAPFVRNLNLTFPILLDVHQVVAQQYGARDLPASFLLNPEGKVIAAAKGERDWFSKQAISYLEELIVPNAGGKPASRTSP